MSRRVHIIDPQYFSETRSCEFRLTDTEVAYLTSGAYLALGATVAGDTEDGLEGSSEGQRCCSFKKTGGICVIGAHALGH